MEEIEILDFDDDIKEEKKDNKKTKKSKKKETKNSRVQSKKTLLFQKIFCLISGLFIFGCCIFYGFRFVKYYRVYNPKGENGSKIQLLGNKISGESEIVYEGSGLYLNNGLYIYKGDVDNNYIKFSNMIWRITKINQDGTVEIILDKYLNQLKWDNSNNNFVNSDISGYLNNEFIKFVEKDSLLKTSICIENVNELTNISCDNTSKDNFINLLDVSTYLGSIVDEKSYLVDDDEVFWLRDRTESNIWHTNGNKVSMSDAKSIYEIRPVVTLKASVPYYSGNGSIDNPYLIAKEEKSKIGSYYKINDDLWILYNNESDYKLVLKDTLNTQLKYSDSEHIDDYNDSSNIYNYLNNEYLNNLEYKNILKDTDWYNGTYDSYKDVFKNKYSGKVGMLNITDLIFNDNDNSFYLANKDSENLIYVYGEYIKSSKPILSRGIRPCIMIDKNTKISGGLGTITEPFIVEE